MNSIDIRPSIFRCKYFPSKAPCREQKYLLLRLIRVAYAKERRVRGEIYQAR